MESDSTSTPSTTVEALRKALQDLGLDTRGHKPELKKRLRKAKKKLAAQNEKQQQEEERNKTRPSPLPSSSAGATCIDGQKQQEQKSQQKEDSELTQDRDDQPLKKQPFDYYLFFDVEATCEEGGSFEYPNEIIEFPIVLVDGRTFEIVDEFRSYVKPGTNPILSDYCIKLTGIDQVR
ncbi:hypothetical protein BDB00DRAFT_783628 [Zychaea mexicana]|uniref:uncharacterized protein n=1 Tax=Zychaea mexicana TaxID=64656 RepID=UPI0022FDDE7D|nr:uncharacterized protein BDB00DRAFT_783628 [Zychaea mexicana]KAI9499028.1 hypothetical protein BDB00DRAFT_783628 [Zychaea mexicana]